MGRGLQLKGSVEFLKKIRNLPSVIKKEVGGETFASAKEWERLAKQSAPVDQGRLRAAIHATQVGETASTVVCNVEYVAFVEWGTKSRVKVPPDLESYAATFRGNGAGSGKAREMIYAWMNRVGIPPERQWYVFVSIIVKGIKPHPFFFIHKPIVQRDFNKNVRNILNTEH